MQPIRSIRPLALSLLLTPLLLAAQPEHHPNEALAQLELAREAYAANDLDKALAHADSALTMDAAVPGGYKLRGDIRQRQSNLHGALLDYTKAEKTETPTSRLYVSRSAVYITEGRLKEAMRDIEKAIKLDPGDPDVWYNRACANYLGANNEGALRDLETCIKLRPENPDALFLRGVVKGELFREEDGLEDITAAMKMKPEIDGAQLSAAVLLYELERYEEAIAAFSKVVDKADDDLQDALYYRADCHYQLGNKDDACVDWRRAGELGEKDAQFIVRNYCLTDADKIPKKPARERRKTVIEF